MGITEIGSEGVDRIELAYDLLTQLCDENDKP
jgi:hypothetical protein